jgi:hypothetical protein
MKLEIPEKQLSELKLAYQIFGGELPVELFFNHKSKPPLTVFVANEEAFLQNTIARNLGEYTCYYGIQERRIGLNQPAKNGDISMLKWLYIDIDAVKPTKDVCSSNEEKALTLIAAKSIIADFITDGYKEPVLVDSGNGYWIFLLMQGIPIDDTNRAEISARLKAWGSGVVDKWGGQFQGVNIDGGIYDLRRITKIPGTKVFNKNETENRPQRQSSLVSTHTPEPDQKLYEDFMALEITIEEPQKPQGSTHHISSDKLHPGRIYEKCYTINFFKNKALSKVSLPHKIRLALSTIANGLDDLNNDLCFIKPILSGCLDYDEAKTLYYLRLNLGHKPYSCEKLTGLGQEYFIDFDPALCCCNLIQIGTAKPSPIRYAYPSTQDMEAGWNAIEWSTDDPLKRYQQQKAFAAGWFKFFDRKDCEEFLRGHKHDNGLLRADTIKSLVKANTEQKDERTICDLLLAIAGEGVSYYKDGDGNIYAEFEIDGHIETHQVRSKGFDQWLRRKYYNLFKKGCPSLPMTEAVLTIEAKNLWDCETFPVFVRVGGDSDRVYVDLCNPEYEVVEITANGYQIIKNSPVKFRRASGMLPLPHPVGGGSLALLKEFLNLKNPTDFILVCAWLIGCLKPSGPYTVLSVVGEQGSAKSSCCRDLRELVDPSTTPLRQIPREVRDLMISATNSRVLAFDNMSNIPIWLSDSFCRLTDGSGMSIRAMYTDRAEEHFQAERPILLNGINPTSTEPDLADRTITITLTSISETDRKTKSVLRKRFDIVKPQIFGALCQAASIALRNLPNIWPESLPRMADFALWGIAAEPAYCQPGEFMAAYARNMQNVIDESIQASLVMENILKMTDADDFQQWDGTPSELLELLNEKVGDKIQRSKAWPKEPNQLIRKLNKGAPQLRSRGITFQLSGKHPKTRRKLYTLSKGSENIVRTVRSEENKPQHTDNVNEKERTMNDLSSFVSNKTSFAVGKTSFAAQGAANDVFDLRTMNEGVRTMKEKNTVRSINEGNQDIASIFSNANDANDDLRTLRGDVITPINSKAPEKPQVRIVI